MWRVPPDLVEVEDAPGLLRLPPVLADVYAAARTARARVRIGTLVLHSYDHACRTRDLGVDDDGGAWTYRSVTDEVVGTDGTTLTPTRFLQRFAFAELRRRAQDDECMRRKCVDGTYVPSPVLVTPPSWGDFCED